MKSQGKQTVLHGDPIIIANGCQSSLAGGNLLHRSEGNVALVSRIFHSQFEVSHAINCGVPFLDTALPSVYIESHPDPDAAAP